jgi:hypothetical protein
MPPKNNAILAYFLRRQHAGQQQCHNPEKSRHSQVQTVRRDRQDDRGECSDRYGRAERQFDTPIFGCWITLIASFADRRDDVLDQR